MADVDAALNDLFKLCRHSFVPNFLFKGDALADITMLTSPVQAEHAISARIFTNGTDVSASPTTMPLVDYSTEFYYASLPAFSVNSLTLGFCTTRPIAAANSGITSACTSGLQPTFNRFIRCDRTATLFVVAEEAHTNTLGLDSVTHHTTTTRTRTCARFSATHFHALRNTTNTFPDATAFRPALQLLTIARETRDCLICKSPSQIPCDCTLPLLQPEHPLDFRHERHNMCVHTGYFQGGARVKLFTPATLPVYPLDLSRVRTHVSINGLDEPALHADLICAAVQRRLADLRVHSGRSFPHVPALLEDASRTSLSAIASHSSRDAPDFDPRSWEQGDGLDSLFALTEGGVSEARPVTDAVALDTARVGVTAVGSGQADAECRAIEEEEQEVEVGDGSGGSVTKTVLADSRKERNRRAAARSNLRRKIRNEALRKDLAEVQARLAVLRDRERVLREENVQLRLAAGRRKFNVSRVLTHVIT